jgi:hypothetical protein
VSARIRIGEAEDRDAQREYEGALWLRGAMVGYDLKKDVFADNVRASL